MSAAKAEDGVFLPDSLKIILRYKKIILMVIVLTAVFMCMRYICRWEQQMKVGYRFLSGFDDGISKNTGIDILHESRYFPVVKNGKAKSFFEDGYGEGRSFGGKRRHEGIDIMSSENKAGIFKVRSVCDGKVENKGWLKLGGYRIGIRSDSGNYYYYAHLDSYRKGLKCNDRVRAGEIIGYMGNTGYGNEGTRGKFPVHLHFGIYVAFGKGEKCVNPYYLLKKLEM